MKAHKIIIPVLAIVISGLAAWLIHEKERTSRVPEASTGTLEFYHDFPSKHIQPRTVAVWLPDGYETGEECNVLYMHDGQMLFDSTTTWNHQEWKVDEVFGKMIADGLMKRTIVVAIDNTKDRLRELLPGKIRSYMEPEAIADTAYPLGDNYLRFVVEELKPFIDEKYRPLTGRGNTFIAGSSMGGLMALCGAVCYNDCFSKAACVSSTVSPCMASVRRDIRSSSIQEDTRIYLSFGTEEAFLPDSSDPMKSLTAIHNLTVQKDLIERGVRTDLYCQIGGGHNEASWELQIPRFMDFLWR